MIFDTVGESIAVRVLVKRIAKAVAVCVVRHVRSEHGVGAAGLLVDVQPAVAVRIIVAHVARTVVIDVRGDTRGQKAVRIAIQFVDIGPRISVVIVIVNVGGSVAIGVEEHRFGVLIVVDNVVVTQTSGKDQHQGKKGSKQFVHDASIDRTDINLFPIVVRKKTQTARDFHLRSVCIYGPFRWALALTSRAKLVGEEQGSNPCELRTAGLTLVLWSAGGRIRTCEPIRTAT